MVSTFRFCLGALVFIQGIAGHGKIYTFTADSVDYIGFRNDDSEPSAGWTNTMGANFVGVQDGVFPIPWSLQTEDAICGTAAHPGAISANVSAGGWIDFDFTTWPGNHFGPMLTYMANCRGPCETVDKNNLEWFKIAELGLVNKTLTGTTYISGTWAVPNLLNANAGPKGSTWRVIIPPTIAPGNYVVRIETIALHNAMQGEIQDYPFCFNFKVSGSGTANPRGIKGPLLYHQTDPAFSYDVFADPLADFIIPGPLVWRD